MYIHKSSPITFRDTAWQNYGGKNSYDFDDVTFATLTTTQPSTELRWHNIHTRCKREKKSCLGR